MDRSDPARDSIHETIQANMGPDGAILTGWALVAEWADGGGERWLSKGHCATTPAWAAAGYFHEALYGQWPEGDSG